MNGREDFRSALGIAAVALGMDFVSGRSIAAFYAQMARSSWLGAVFAGLIFGLLIGAVSHLARRTGANHLPGAFMHLPGGALGGLIGFLYHVLLVVAACMLAVEAGHMGELALPLKNGAAWGMILALLFACTIALSGKEAMKSAGGVLIGAIGLFFLALLLLGRLGEEPRYALDLRLRDSWAAALIFAILHAVVCACLSAGMAVRFSDGRTHPARLGAYSGGIFMLLLLGGNAVLRIRPDELLALKYPFVALAGGWGSSGFYLSAALIFASAALSLAGIICALMRRS